nr:uncharacterized protein LOC109158743 [Ipomoea batatas]
MWHTIDATNCRLHRRLFLSLAHSNRHSSKPPSEATSPSLTGIFAATSHRRPPSPMLTPSLRQLVAANVVASRSMDLRPSASRAAAATDDDDDEVPNDNMLSSQTEKQGTAGASAEEADLLRRSKKKTKRDAQPEDRTQAEDGGAPSNPDDITAETRTGPTWKTGTQGAENQEASRPLGDKYGSWMIAQRKNRNYQNTGYQRHNTGRQTGGKTDSSKGTKNGSQGNNSYHFNKEGFKVWNNTRFGALDSLEEDHDEEAQEDIFLEENPEGPSGTLLSGKGKRPQVQISEAQLLNDNMRQNKQTTMNKQKVYRAKQGEKSAEKSRKNVNQAAETEGHTVVRGFNNGNRVEKTVINEEGRTTEVFHFQAGENEHHQDPPNTDKTLNMGDEGDPMADVEFTTGQTSEDPEVVEQ